MEKSNKGEPEETVELQDLAVQEEDSESFQSDQQSQKSEGKLMQQEPAQEVKTVYSLQKSEENKSSLKRRRKFAADEELELDTNGSKVVQQKYGSSFAVGQDSILKNQSYAIRKEFGVFTEDKLLESDGNTTAQRTDETPKSILPNLDLQVTRQDNATHQDRDRSESLKSKLEANLTEQLSERTLEESSIVLMEDPTMDGRSLKPILPEEPRERNLLEISLALIEDLRAEQEENGGLQQEYDLTSENDLHLEGSESDQESENSHECFLTQQMEEESSSQLPSRICYHRTHTQRQRLSPVTEVPDEPLDPFEVEIALNSYRRTLGARPLRTPTGFRNYLQSVIEYHIPPERRVLYSELQRRILKLFCSLILGALFIVMMVLLLNYLEDKYSNPDDSHVTSPVDDFSDDLSTAVTGLKTDTSVICLEADTTTPMVYSINFRADFDTEVTSELNNVDSSTYPVNDLE